MRFVKLQVVLLLVAVVVVLGLGADVVLKNRAETEMARRITAKVPETSGVRARIRSFPFVGRVLVSGQISQVDVTAQHSAAGGVDLNDIFVRVEEVEMDTGAAIDGRVEVRSIKRGSVQADLRQGEINRRLPRQVQVQLQRGSAAVSGPAGSQANLTVTPEGVVQLRAGERTLLNLSLPKSDLLPCHPSATFVTGAIRLSCTFSEIPDLLVDLAQR